jgi:asparagine synthase (glutamine-hydrolysing)
VAKAASEHVTVILTGDGGDELFGGYTRYGYLRRAQQIHDRLRPFATVSGRVAEAAGRVLGSRRLAGGGRWIRDPWSGYRDGLFHFHPREIEGLLTSEFLEQVRPTAPAERLDALWGMAPGRSTTPLRVDQQTYLPDDLLVKMDRAAMAHSLEARSPLLDHVLAEYAATLPGSLLFDGASTGKAIVRHAYRDALPPEVLTRRKMGFGVPLASWLRNELRPVAEELLLPETGPLRPWVRPEAVGSLVRALLAGDDGPKWKVWNLLALAGWASARDG